MRAMREAREKADIGVGRMDEFQVEEEEDVYEYVEEEEYRKLVESRRQREDFVVDDGMSTREKLNSVTWRPLHYYIH